MGEHLLLLTSDPATQQLTVNTVELNHSHGAATWMSVMLGHHHQRGRPRYARRQRTVHMAYGTRWTTMSSCCDCILTKTEIWSSHCRRHADGGRPVEKQRRRRLWRQSTRAAAGCMPNRCRGLVVRGSGCADYDTDGFRDEIDGCDDQGGRHGLTALVAKTEIKTAGLITSLAMLMATSTIPIGNKPLTPMAMVLAITTAWIAVQPALTRTPTAGTSSLTSLPNTVIMTAMDTVITTLTPSTAITVRGTLGHHSETETVA